MNQLPQSSSPRMPEWLVSVRDLREAKLAVDFGVQILDWKEPDRGPLAPVDAKIWRSAVQWSAGRFTLSAALGEPEQAIEIARQVPHQFRFAKVGPSGCPVPSALRQLWRRVAARLPATVELVPVAYADHQVAQCPTPKVVFEVAAEAGFRRVLLDTYGKAGETSAGLLGDESLESLGRFAASCRIWWSLAGSVRLSAAQSIWGEESGGWSARPDCVAVRGDVCGHDRTGSLCAERLAAWSDWLRRPDDRDRSPTPSPDPSSFAAVPQNFRSTRRP